MDGRKLLVSTDPGDVTKPTSYDPFGDDDVDFPLGTKELRHRYCAGPRVVALAFSDAAIGVCGRHCDGRNVKQLALTGWRFPFFSLAPRKYGAAWPRDGPAAVV